MTTTDKLTDATLKMWLKDWNNRIALLSRELLAHRRASQAAPALSDGLREEVARRILDDAISSVEDDMRADMEDAEDTGEHVDVGQYEIVLSYETAQTIRAALSASPAQEGDTRHD